MTYSKEAHTRADGEGHILVDFDRTLAHYTSWTLNGPTLGNPIPAMVERVRRWVAAGEDVRIFTARAAANNPRVGADTVAIQDWCREHIGMVLAVTNQKDFQTKAIWDDIAVTVEPNTGWRWSAECPKDMTDPLSHDEEARLTGYAADFKDDSRLTEPETKDMMVKLASARGMVSQYDEAFVNPPKLVPTLKKKDN